MWIFASLAKEVGLADISNPAYGSSSPRQLEQ